NVVPHAHDLVVGKVTHLHGELHATGNHVGSAGFNLQVTYVADLRALFAAHYIAHGEHVFGSSRQRIMAAVHGRSARVIGKALDRAGPAAHRNDALHYAHWDFPLVQTRALLDVQFQRSGNRALHNTRLAKPGGVLAVAAQPIGESDSLVVFVLKN